MTAWGTELVRQLELKGTVSVLDNVSCHIFVTNNSVSYYALIRLKLNESTYILIVTN